MRRRAAGVRKGGRPEPIQWPGDPAKPVLRGIRPLSTGGKWTERPPGGLYTKGEMPPGAPRSPVLRKSSSAPQPRVCRVASLCSCVGTGDEGRGRQAGGGKISENRRLTKFGKTGILRPLPNRSQPEGGAQDDQRKHGLVRIGRKEAWTEGALRTHAALRSKTAFFCALSVFLQDGERFFCAFPKISFVL